MNGFHIGKIFNFIAKTLWSKGKKIASTGLGGRQGQRRLALVPISIRVNKREKNGSI